jgi:hypothetical protein
VILDFRQKLKRKHYIKITEEQYEAPKRIPDISVLLSTMDM